MITWNDSSTKKPPQDLSRLALIVQALHRLSTYSMPTLFKLGRLRSAAVLSLRHASSLQSRSPRELYEHLSQYIVGQDRAKRVLSVAVFNHYLRIAPLAEAESAPTPPPSRPPNSPPPASSDKLRHSSTASDARPTAKTARAVPIPETDPAILSSDGDPAATHLHQLTAETGEKQWARDYFISQAPSLTPSSALHKAIKRRKAPSDDESLPPGRPSPTSPTSSLFPPFTPFIRPPFIDTAGTDGESLRRIRLRAPDMEELDPRPAVAETDTADAERNDQDIGKGRKVEIEKSNVLMIGPTGTGKTLMTKTLARVLDVPFASCDATTYTSAGYVGDDVETCILRLLQAADYDVARAERGIIHIDEIDKLARRGAGDGFATWGGGRDVGGEGVQQAFLRLLEGTTVTLQAKPPPITAGSKKEGKDDIGGEGWASDANLRNGLSGMGPKRGVRDGLPGFGASGSSGKAETFVVDTSNILFICSGAFVGLENLVNSRIGKGSMGFGARLPSPPPDRTTGDLPDFNPEALKGLATPDLTQYGLIPEFLGRLPIISTLHPLSVHDLVRILTEPKNALVKQYQAMFEAYGSELIFTRKALEAVATEGLKRGGGARGLRGVLEEVLGDAMFEVPSSGVRYCLITESTVKKETEALYFSRGQKYLCEQRAEEEDRSLTPDGIRQAEWESEEDGRIRASG
ncbi:putative ATP-dependent Clp protease ATP-binding subunit [Papiliotrema laurentii]|uniref:ATP-dependent Clp protease ATP-binding subunit n=1 Tax=Papiliotrema laurentii TaxID=5418 RepID=A0AAD9FMW8_PAPLA|nr:putative ATP-dependent Clp protease ATP-binding subunit [Papiliotrema laurentii]